MENIKEKVAYFKDLFVNFIPNLKTNFLAHLNDLKQKLKNFGGSFKNSYIQLKDKVNNVTSAFKTGIVGSVNNITRAIANIFTPDKEAAIHLQNSSVSIDFQDLG